MEGWIKIHRNFLEWEWFDDDAMLRLFLTILLLANHKDGNWHGIHVNRGQLITSRHTLSQRTGLSDQQIRTCLYRLENTGEICRQSTKHNTIITICNYDKYQVEDIDNQPTNNQPITNQQPEHNQQSTTNKNDKNIITDTQDAPAREDSLACSWRFVSSVQRFALHNNPDEIAEFKRGLFRREVEVYAVEVGMPAREQEKFVGWWTEHDPGKEKIRAEFEAVFNVPDRMKTWMDRNTTRGSQPAQKSRMDKLEDDMNFINAFFDGKQSSTAAPDEQ